MRRLTAFTLFAATFSAQVHAQIAPLVTVHSEDKPAYVSPFDKKEPTSISQTLRLPGYVPLIESPIKAEVPAIKPVQRQMHATPVHVVKNPKVVVHQAQRAINASAAAPSEPMDVVLAATAAVVSKVSMPEVQSHTPSSNTGITMPEMRPAPVQQQAPMVIPSPLVLAQQPQAPRVNVATPAAIAPEQAPSYEAPAVAPPPVQHEPTLASAKSPSETFDWPAAVRKLLESRLSIYTLAFAGLASLCAVGFMLRERIVKMWTNRDPAMHDPWFSK